MGLLKSQVLELDRIDKCKEVLIQLLSNQVRCWRCRFFQMKYEAQNAYSLLLEFRPRANPNGLAVS